MAQIEDGTPDHHDRADTMVDFGELKDKAQDLVAQHSDTAKDGITKVGRNPPLPCGQP